MAWQFGYTKDWIAAPARRNYPTKATLQDIGPALLSDNLSAGSAQCSGSVSLLFGGPYKGLVLGMAAPEGDGAGLTLWYASVSVTDIVVLDWAPGSDPTSPTTLSDTSSLGLSLERADRVEHQYLGWTGTDDAQTINLAAAKGSDPAAAQNPIDYVKTTFWGQTSGNPTAVAGVEITQQAEAYFAPFLAWTGTGNLKLNILSVVAIPGAAALDQAILDEYSANGPNLTTVPIADGEYMLWLTWVGTDGGNSLNVLRFSPTAKPVGTAATAVVVQSPSLCAPALVGKDISALHPDGWSAYMAWIDRETGKLALAYGAGNDDPLQSWQGMVLVDLVDANGAQLTPDPAGGVALAQFFTEALFVACVDKESSTARVFEVPLQLWQVPPP